MDVIARLDRANQYSRVSAMDREVLEYRAPRFSRVVTVHDEAAPRIRRIHFAPNIGPSHDAICQRTGAK
jgi:hypothetical protein